MPRASISYLNATLASWLDYDLAQVGSGGLKIADIVSGNGAALLTTLAAAPGEVKTEVLRHRLQDPRRTLGAGAAVPQGRVSAPTAARRLAHAGAQPRARRGGRSAARRRSALHALLPVDADGDRHGGQGRADFAHQYAVRADVPVARSRATRTFDPVRRLRARPRGAGRRDPPRRRAAERDRAGRHRAGRRRRPLGALLRLGGRGRRARRGSRHRLRAGNHRPAHAGEPGQPARPHGVGRPARRRHRARLQQRAVRHHDGDGLPAQRAQADRSVVPGHHADQAERQPGGEPGAAAAGVLAAADAAAAGARSRRRACRAQHAAAPADRREGRARSQSTAATCGR